MAKLNEYYPSLVTGEYALGQFYMFNRNDKIEAKKISDQHREFIDQAKGGFKLADEKGGFRLSAENSKGKKGGFKLANDSEDSISVGGFKLADGTVDSEQAEFKDFANVIKKYGHYSHEAGKIIGINQTDSKIYVQFSDTEDGYCHIFKTGIASDSFDIIDRFIQINAK